MKHWKSIGLLALVFFAGIFVGVVATRAVVRHVVQQAIAHPEKAQLLMERNLTRKLRLDDGQQTKLHQILLDTRNELRGLRQELQPQAAVVLRRSDEKISALLTPEQQARYEKLKTAERPLLQALRQAP